MKKGFTFIMCTVIIACLSACVAKYGPHDNNQSISAEYQKIDEIETESNTSTLSVENEEETTPT